MGVSDRETSGYWAGDMDFSAVVEEERDLMECMRHQRGKSTEAGASKERVRFSLAFSGGGIRAAAFQAGVLWRLADEGLLKDVEYFSGVSGGAYVASSFVSHLLAAELPPPGEEDQWYRDVVARTLCRMQSNAGNFVRDAVKRPGKPEDGAGSIPQIFDGPILLIVLLITLSYGPFTFFIGFMVPLTEAIELFFGAGMRGAFCMSGSGVAWDVLLEMSDLNLLFSLLAVSVAASWLVRMIRLVPKWKRGHASYSYLCAQGLLDFLVRFTLGLLFLMILIIGVLALQVWAYRDDEQEESGLSPSRAIWEMCDAFIRNKTSNPASGSGIGAAWSCSDLNGTAPWYYNTQFKPSSLLSAHSPSGPLLNSTKDNVLSELSDVLSGKSFHIVPMFSNYALLILFVLLCFAPCKPDLLLSFLSLLGPLLVAALAMALIQYRVYGPLRGPSAFDGEAWKNIVGWSLSIAACTATFHDFLNGLWHSYYRWCVQTSFFAHGAERKWSEIKVNPYCPFLLYTGSANDFMRPGDATSTSEISVTALHVGSPTLGYNRMMRHSGIAKWTALTAAGCLDAICMTMASHTRLRILLKFLNLSWGDYIIFVPRVNRCIRALVDKLPIRFEAIVIFISYRLPGVLCWLLNYILLNVAWNLAQDAKNASECQTAKRMYILAALFFLGVLFLSFFAFLPGLNSIMYSSLIRQIHQTTRHRYVANRPPSMLYVTDGGVSDCTTIVQLIRRKCERILLVLAAADPFDELAVLRTAMQVVLDQEIASFYDPVDPRRNVQICMDEFRKDRSLPYLHLGIRYGWDGKQAEETGHLFVVKNRLPPEFEGQLVPPLLTEEEIRFGKVAGGGTCRGNTGEWGDLHTDELGGFGCCDCCHTCGCNCGRKFPALTFTGYLYLTPTLFNGLCRLGHDLSKCGVAAITRPGSLDASMQPTSHRMSGKVSGTSANMLSL